MLHHLIYDILTSTYAWSNSYIKITYKIQNC